MTKLIKAFRLKCGTEVVGQVDEQYANVPIFVLEKPVMFFMMATPQGPGAIPMPFAQTFKVTVLQLSHNDYYTSGDPEERVVQIYMTMTSAIALPQGAGLSLVTP